VYDTEDKYNSRMVHPYKTSTYLTFNITADATIKRYADRIHSIYKRNDIKDESKHRIARALRYHTLALKSYALDNQFLNMWTALEYLVKKGKEEGIISTIINSVPPLLAISNPRKLLNALAFDMAKFNLNLPEELKHIHRSPKKIDISKLYLLLQNRESSKFLYDYTKNYSFLCYRIYTIKETIKDGKSIARNVDRHQTNLCWQLQRIYRTRNMLIHSAVAPSNLPELLKNLNNYLLFTLSEVLKSFDQNKYYTSLEDIFICSNANYHYFLEGLKNGSIDINKPENILWPDLPH
jgi:hypothetical protein